MVGESNWNVGASLGCIRLRMAYRQDVNVFGLDCNCSLFMVFKQAGTVVVHNIVGLIMNIGIFDSFSSNKGIGCLVEHFNSLLKDFRMEGFQFFLGGANNSSLHGGLVGVGGLPDLGFKSIFPRFVHSLEGNISKFEFKFEPN